MSYKRRNKATKVSNNKFKRIKVLKNKNLLQNNPSKNNLLKKLILQIKSNFKNRKSNNLNQKILKKFSC